MLAGWIRAFVVLVVPMLLVNAECYATCTSDACSSAQTPSDSCHHHKSSKEDNARCPYQHSEFVGPEAGLANVSVSAPVTILPAMVADSTALIIDPEMFSQPDTGSPPGSDVHRTISILRI